jgi:16S rRNA (cytidine1402-2'-O)-methyltransferase
MSPSQRKPAPRVKLFRGFPVIIFLGIEGGNLMTGILYVVATPIGNLKDITIRAIEVLGEVDFVVAESRERALKLLSHLDIRKPITTINSFNEENKAKAIVDQVSKGKNAALITAAGTPCISDPGDRIVRRSYDAGIEIQAIPGPSAAIAALSISGLSPDRFLFYGFLPLKKGKKKKILAEILSGPYAVALYESPRRIRETLSVISEEAGERMVMVYREMTKVYEEVLRGSAGEVLEAVAGDETRGEYTIIVEGKKKQAAP